MLRNRQAINLFIVGAALSYLFIATPPVSAAGFASPSFQRQWEQGEMLVPNFWGDPANARLGHYEQYRDLPGGQRLVQYFDKGRMEMKGDAVTNGLLATELLTGQIQKGDTTFETRTPPSIPIAGDPDNVGPTYAALMSKGAGLIAGTKAASGSQVMAAVSTAGEVTSANASKDPETVLSAYDDATKHNVPRAFAQYRDKAGLSTIGYARCEPFLANVRVAGQQRSVMVQAFERRVLTYTASNPDAFKVEMGNIGQHYYRWRYGYGLPVDSPPGGGITFGVDPEEDQPLTDPHLIYQYTHMVGVAPRIVHSFLNWKDGGRFNVALNDEIVAGGATPLLTWSPDDGSGDVSEPAFTNAAITGGKYDGLLRQWGQDLATWNKPLYLRFAHEMNGNWYPWAVGVNGNTTASYVAMWQHVVGVMRDAGGGLSNVHFVWGPDVIGAGSDFTAMYPGDAFVDWVGLDVYNLGATQGSKWRTFPEIFSQSYQAMTRLTTKPLMIPEIGVVEQGGNKAAWLTQTFLNDIPSRFPLIRAVVYFDEDKRADGESDWRISTSHESLAAYRQIVGSPSYQGRLP